MSNETAAAILTKLAFEQNTKLKKRLTQAQGKEKELASVMMPLFRQILSEMETDRQSHDKFRSGVATHSPQRVNSRPQPNLRRVRKARDRDDEHDIGGEG